MGKNLTDAELKMLADNSQLDRMECEQRYETWAACVNYALEQTFRRFLAHPPADLPAVVVLTAREESNITISDEVLDRMNGATRSYITQRRRRRVPSHGIGHDRLEEACSA